MVFQKIVSSFFCKLLGMETRFNAKNSRQQCGKLRLGKLTEAAVCICSSKSLFLKI